MWVGNRWRTTDSHDDNQNYMIKQTNNHKSRTATNSLPIFQKHKDMSSRSARNAFAKKQERLDEKPPCKRQNANHTHLVHTTKRLTRERKCAGKAPNASDVKATKLKTLITKQTAFINQEQRKKMPRDLSPRILLTKKATIALVT